MGLSMEKPMKPRLLILSDLWGKERANWMSYYSEPLSKSFDIQYYDCCELGDIDKFIYTEEALHKQFVNGGLDRAIARLIELEQEDTHFLAFSIGGTIAWQFALKTGKVKSLYAVSSTRLRYETEKPEGKIKLWYGEADKHAPSQDWFDQLEIDHKIVRGQGHLIYRRAQFAADVAGYLLSIT